jgi:phosphoglycerol transferase
VVYQLWRARIDVPFDLHGDARFNIMTIRNLIEQGWFQRSPRLGAPFGLDLHDFPLGGDNLQFVLLRLLAVTGGSAGAVMNAYLILTFVLVAVTSAFVLRWLGLSEAVAGVFAVAYAFLPYHFYRGEHHLFLSAYWCVPLAAYLAICIVQERPIFQPRARAALTFGVCAVIGMTDPYYTGYALLLLIVAGGAVALRHRNLRLAAPAVAIAAVLVMVLGLNLAPSILYRQQHGRNAEVAVRFPVESEIYGLKPANLVLPRPHHRLPGLGSVAERYAQESPIPSEGGQALGLLGSLGLVWLLLVAAANLLGSSLPGRDAALHGHLALFALASILVGTVGGGSMLIAYFLTPQSRSWARISVVIAFLGLSAAGLLVEQWRAHRLASARHGAAVLVGVLLLALLDQTSGADVPRYRTNAAEYDSDAAFVALVEQRLGAGAMVFQLPVVPFPESPRLADMKDYDQFFGYLHSHRLRWSYGGMKGREADWQQALGGQPTPMLLDRLAAVGFTGLTIDRFGYTDRAVALEEELGRVAGSPAVSPNGRFSFFDLTANNQALRHDRSPTSVRSLADATLRPVRINSSTGFDSSRPDGDSYWVTATGPSASLVVLNPGPGPRPVQFTATLESSGTGTAAIAPPGRTPESVPLRCPRQALRIGFSAPPGTSKFRFTVDAPPLAPEDSTAGPNRAPPTFRLLRPAIWDAGPGAITPLPAC